MENKNNSDEKVSCKYKDASAFVLTCEKEGSAQPTQAEPVANAPEETKPVEQPAAVQTDTEEIEVPIVGDVDDTEESYVEPLGESASWYPGTSNYENVVNYQYGTTASYTASLTNPEEGITASDVILISIIALSCIAVIGAITLLTGRTVSRHTATRKDFIKK